MRALFVLLVLAVWTPPAVDGGLAVTTQSWCDNAMRIRVVPDPYPRAAALTRAKLEATLRAQGLKSLPDALEGVECVPAGGPVALPAGHLATNGNLRVTAVGARQLRVARGDTGQTLFNMTLEIGASSAKAAGFLAAQVNLVAGDPSERIYGLGQGGWTQESPGAIPGCPAGRQRVVPLARNGQTVSLQQRKFHVTIPFAVSSVGYGFVFNMPGAGVVTVGEQGMGGMAWRADAALGIDVWLTTVPAGVVGSGDLSAIYKQYADATGHAPALREEAMLFWQSRNRYKSSSIAQSVAQRYAHLKLPVGVLVIDYKNQRADGDFAPNPACYPSVRALSDGIKAKLNATTVFSFWPEAMKTSAEYALLHTSRCLINPDLGGLAIDTTVPSCRALIWEQFLRPRYYQEGVSSYWLDETDGEGTSNNTAFNDHHGYDTTLGPAAAFSNLWVGSWIRSFSEPVAAAGAVPPLVLARGVWAGGQRYGVVLWSSDIWSTFETLASQVPQGVHASMSGIPWCAPCVK